MLVNGKGIVEKQKLVDFQQIQKIVLLNNKGFKDVEGIEKTVKVGTSRTIRIHSFGTTVSNSTHPFPVSKLFGIDIGIENHPIVSKNAVDKVPMVNYKEVLDDSRNPNN